MIDLQKLLDKVVVRTTEVDLPSLGDTAKIRALSSKEVRDAKLKMNGTEYVLHLDEDGKPVVDDGTHVIDLEKLFELKLTYIYHGMLNADGSQMFAKRSDVDTVADQLSDAVINDMYIAIDSFTNGKADVEEVEKN